MKRFSFILLAILLCSSWLLAKDEIKPYKVIEARRGATDGKIRDFWKPVKNTSRSLKREFKNSESIFAGSGENKNNGIDSALQSDRGDATVGAPVQNWAGIGLRAGGGGTPPDTDMDVGPNHVVQMVNSSFSIWDKSGNLLLGPTPNNTLWAGFGGQCEFGNDGDPVVLYDPLADRWILTQFDFSTAQCVAVSQTPDPTGAYYQYQFATPGNDYPKIAVWGDAYYATIRNFSGGASFDAYAWERDQMLVGGPAQAVAFNISALMPTAWNFLAADIDGTTPPPAGSPQYIAGLEDPRNPASDMIFFEMDVNWSNIGSSTLSGPIFVPVSPFDGNVCNFGRNCIDQPQTNRGVDAFSDALMHRLAYRNFGGYQSLVATHTVDVGDFNDHAGVRWYEFRNTGSGWSTRQDGTFAPDGDHRWMPSIAQNANGDIAVGYSVSSHVTYPSIRYAARRAGDPLGEMTLGEGEIVTGGDSQTGVDRWGDYAMMAVDPANENTFWFTTEYYSANSFANDWKTRIASFNATDNGLAITCTADNPPVIIPGSTGGSFDYTIQVENNTGSSQTVDVWTYGRRLNGGGTDTMFKQTGVTVANGGVQTFNVTQNVPNMDPGNFDINCKAGDFSSRNLVSSSAVAFTVGAFAPSKSGVVINEWSAALKGGEVAVNGDEVRPEAISLNQNYPNPFNPTTQISYNLSADVHVKLSVYNTLGQKIKTLVNRSQAKGLQNISWNATNEAGQKVAAGIYLYRLEAGDFVKTMKMALTK